MSAALDTVRAFSDTLANELADAVRAQDEATVAAFDEISTKIFSAREAFIDNLNAIEDRFTAALNAAIEARSKAMKENGAALDDTINEIVGVIGSMRESYK